VIELFAVEGDARGDGGGIGEVDAGEVGGRFGAEERGDRGPKVDVAGEMCVVAERSDFTAP